MSQANPITAAAALAYRTYRIVLFGMPDAGKTSLLGALAQSAQTQEHILRGKLLDTRTLIPTVDVSGDAAQLKQNFAQFTRFLRTLERSRGERTEVGGLPVYLVLTKCDLIAKPADTNAQSMEHIEERKREVHQRFQEFLAEQAAQEQMPFGSTDLHLWATAVKRPSLADWPARPKEPYGVAELFRQCLDSARGFRERRRQATQRLGLVVGLLAVMIGFMALLALFFL